MEGQGFGWAIEQMRIGHHVRRSGWDCSLYLWDDARVGTFERCFTLHFEHLARDRAGWRPSTEDCLALDWQVAS